MTLVKENHASLLEGKRDGNSLASFSFYNRKQVSFPVEYKSTKTIIQEGNHLSTSNNIRILLDIQDPNIIFEDDWIKEGTYKGNNCKFVSGRLSYNPTHCKECGIENKDYTIYKTVHK
ncbi:MAG: hypothetical protein L0L95_13480 [Staphylococcus equorum]|nr:hypothetical protein [Staphylococcus equorum]